MGGFFYTEQKHNRGVFFYTEQKHVSSSVIILTFDVTIIFIPTRATIT